MKRRGFTVIKNALANVMRGGASAVVALALPHFLTRALDHDRFAAWALMLQIAAYANYLDFGLQTAVARYLAQAMERGDNAQRDRLVSTAFAMLAGGGALALLVIGVVAWQLPRIFHGVPLQMMGELRGGVLVLAASAALLLPMSAFTGVLIGLHRNEYPALAIGGTRILGAIAVLFTVHRTHSLVWLAACIGGFNLLGGLLQYAIAKGLLRDMRLHMAHMSSSMAKELAHYCSALMVFSIGMLLVSGLDVTIVGYFNFGAVGYYAIASTLVNFIAGLSGSVFTAMMTPIAVLQERGELARIRDLVIHTTRLSSYASLAITLPVFVFGYAALRLWVGTAYASQALPVLEVLMVAQAIRLSVNSYFTMLVATGQQRYGVAAAVVESLSNLVLSITGALWLGPIGVALGTLAGAVLGIACTFPITMRWAKEVPILPWPLLREGVLRPLLVALPMLLYVALFNTGCTSCRSLKLLVLSAMFSVALALLYGRLLPHSLQVRFRPIC